MQGPSRLKQFLEAVHGVKLMSLVLIICFPGAIHLHFSAFDKHSHNGTNILP